LYSENTGKPWFHHDDAENLRQHREYKLSEAKKPYYQDEPEGPDNLSLIDHIRTHGFPGSILVDPKWRHIVDGNHRLEAAHAIDPNYPVPVKHR
jgi:ParB-like chromosome segregation protein Spo0J